mmetsp:Transcript_6462/g.9454  ORF Transcript_6462/g.9454 Transcript_6462/m.9454 type:complete len:129 (-) Transcript_6462:85-471(-)|eukprot:CAMPEP_0172423214 /NCGR_PEP_ID=MMETSP1064-20121228/14424_1 /TAXON_ID=202472 /ORGANISM="Aulacoseira subarctica , Strain CCAP 1002/5" /LENGTH=128 /DNA_ID=CAMNT_0013164457 /DNA_START=99 /DNA_END=485 /DNA_ORIENTATION=-
MISVSNRLQMIKNGGVLLHSFLTRASSCGIALPVPRAFGYTGSITSFSQAAEATKLDTHFDDEPNLKVLRANSIDTFKSCAAKTVTNKAPKENNSFVTDKENAAANLKVMQFLSQAQAMAPGVRLGDF